ncbi:hypothetical protein [Pseudothauera rhizosphaerae]|uniref:Winged helix DNA-binding domain-containing protein n=1 Tax=Pseudothauera rhizosphaerae TaxID=2565932 RepID=A0A4S4AMX3_9RHOO|nr:hypothetical protein [Pseudothauera rhizosphaerae]THF60935.1 hypothetical protein E6O51_11950 [Pseudothauera rhizosphaerae]
MTARPLGHLSGPFSLSGQLAGLMAALEAAAAPPPPAENARSRERDKRRARSAASANHLRRIALGALDHAGQLDAPRLAALRPDVTTGQWGWVLATLVAAGLVERAGRTGPTRTNRYRITPAGRAAIAPGADHPLTRIGA